MPPKQPLSITIPSRHSNNPPSSYPNSYSSALPPLSSSLPLPPSSPSSPSPLEKLYAFNKSLTSSNQMLIQTYLIQNNTPTLSQAAPSMLSSLKRLNSLSDLMSNTLRRRKGGGKEEAGDEDGKKGEKQSVGSREEEEDGRDLASEIQMKRVLEGIKRILRKNGGERSEKELSFLQERLVETVQFFQTLGVQNEQQILERICHHLTLESFAANESVFQYGESGNKFYIILEGSVGVHVPRGKFNYSGEESSIKANAKASSQIEGKLSSAGNGNDTEIKMLRTGESFGELSLISKKHRMASIICKEKCSFAVLEKKYFYEILHDFEIKKLQKTLEFLAKYKIFENWRLAELSSVFFSIHELVMYRGQPVYIQGEQANEIFFVKSGEFEIRKEMCFFEPNERVLNKSPKKILKSFTLAYYYTDSILGEEDVLLNSNRENSLVCSSNVGNILVLSKSDLFQRWNPELFKSKIDILRKDSLSKKQRLAEQAQKAYRLYDKVLAQIRENKKDILKEKQWPQSEIIKNPSDHNIRTKFPICENYFFNQPNKDVNIKSMNHKRTMSINLPEIQSMIRRKMESKRNQDKNENNDHSYDEKHENRGEQKNKNKNHISKFLEENIDATAQKNGLNEKTNTKITKAIKISERLHMKPNENRANQPSSSHHDSCFEDNTFLKHLNHEKYLQNLKDKKKIDSVSNPKYSDHFVVLDPSQTLNNLNQNLSNETLSVNPLDLDPSRRKLGDALKKLHSFRKKILPIGKNKTESKDFFLMNDFEKKIDDFKKIQDEKYGTFNYSLERSSITEDKIDRSSILGVLNPSKYKEIEIATDRLIANKFNKKFHLKR